MPDGKKLRGPGAALALAAVLGPRASRQPLQREPCLFNDSHFHLTNYIQQGTDMRQVRGRDHGRQGLPVDAVRHPAAADLVVRELGRLRADVLPADGRAALLLLVHRCLHRERVPEADARAAQAARPDDHRVQPGRHVRGRPHPARAGDLSRACSRGIGEFTIHKEFVSSKVAGDTASLTDPALDRILDFAGEVGLVVILHNDIDMPFAKAGAEPVFLTADEGPAAAPSEDDDHLGAHGPRPRRPPGAGPGERRHGERNPRHIEIVEAMIDDPALSHVYFDISWDEVAKYAVSSPESIAHIAAMLNRYPDRFLFGTDNVAPPRPGDQLRVYGMWEPIWAQLTPEASRKIRNRQLRAAVRCRAQESSGLGGRQRQVIKRQDDTPPLSSIIQGPGPDEGPGPASPNSRGRAAACHKLDLGRARSGPQRKSTMSISLLRHAAPTPWPRAALLATLLAALLAAPAADASFLSGDALATAANYMAIVVIIVVPIAADRAVLAGARPAREDRAQAAPPAEGRDPGAVPAVAGVRRPAVAARLAVGLHEARAVQDGVRHGQARGLLRGTRRSAHRDAGSVRDEVAACGPNSTGWRRAATRRANSQAIRDRLAALEPRLAATAEEAR